MARKVPLQNTPENHFILTSDIQKDKIKKIQDCKIKIQDRLPLYLRK